MGEILNRREQIVANKLPPEIPDPDTLVSKTDYATASKAGVVKIGSNINVSSGKISVPAASDETAGVVKVGANLSIDESGALNASSGGITVEEIWSGNITTTATDYELVKPYSDYTILFMQSLPSINATRGGDLIVVDLMTSTENGTNFMKAGGVDVEVKIVDDTHFNMKAGQSLNGVHIIGIK